MIWTIDWAHAAEKDLRRLSSGMSTRVQDAVDRFAATGAGDVKRLVGAPPR